MSDVYKADLLRKLKAGKSVDELAEELTAALNAAKQEYESKSKKVEDGEAVAIVINHYIATHYNNFGREGSVVSRKDIEDICDAMVDIIKHADELKDSLRSVNVQKKEVDSDDAVIERWLRSLG